MAGIFENFRCAHHPDTDIRIPLAMDYLNHVIDVEYAQMVLEKRDRLTWLEMESSTLAGILIQAMIVAYPKTKFILIIRDVYS